MRSSTWRTLGNTYVLVERGEEPLDPATARGLAADADGVLEVVAADAASMEIVVWNPDGSRAELSGNGTRIAATWLAERSGATDLEVKVGERVVRVRMLATGEVEQDLGEVVVGAAELVDGVELTPVHVGNPHAVVVGDPAEVSRLGRVLERHARFPDGTNVQVVRIESPATVRARVWERGVGETGSSGTSAVAVAAATHDEGEVLVRFPAGDLRVRLEGGRGLLVGPRPERVQDDQEVSASSTSRPSGSRK